MTSASDRLIEAVKDYDVDASLKLLLDAGSPCQARDLAQAAHKKTSENFFGPVVNYSVVLNPFNNSETLTIGLGSEQHNVEIAGIVQARCRR